MVKIKPGDFLVLKQENGQELHILVHPDSILVRAERVGTKLETEKKSDYLQYVRVVERN